MDGFITFLIIIGIANAIIKWARKQAADGKKGQGAAPEKPWQRMIGDVAKSMEDAMNGKQPTGNVPAAPVFKTLKNPIYNGGGTDGGAGAPLFGSMAYQPTAIPGAELASSPGDQSAEGTSLPQEPVPQWRGSLPGTEGSVALTANLKEMPVMERAQETYPALNLQFNRNTLVQAVVMQEILTRPQDRRRRWTPH